MDHMATKGRLERVGLGVPRAVADVKVAAGRRAVSERTACLEPLASRATRAREDPRPQKVSEGRKVPQAPQAPRVVLAIMGSLVTRAPQALRGTGVSRARLEIGALLVSLEGACAELVRNWA